MKKSLPITIWFLIVFFLWAVGKDFQLIVGHQQGVDYFIFKHQNLLVFFYIFMLATFILDFAASYFLWNPRPVGFWVCLAAIAVGVSYNGLALIYALADLQGAREAYALSRELKGLPVREANLDRIFTTEGMQAAFGVTTLFSCIGAFFVTYNRKYFAAQKIDGNERQEPMKLYKFSDAKKEYWEVWDNGDKSHTIHWGELGTRGESKIVNSSFLKKSESIIKHQIDELVAEGFKQIDEEDQFILVIEYAIDGMGNYEDLEKRNRLIDRMNDTLGWTGLGHCDGGGIGSDTMDVCNIVVDFEIAKSVIEKDLVDTEFANFTRIFDENS
jgi:predicted DNA-binding WGR domain protein